MSPSPAWLSTKIVMLPVVMRGRAASVNRARLENGLDDLPHHLALGAVS